MQDFDVIIVSNRKVVAVVGIAAASRDAPRRGICERGRSWARRDRRQSRVLLLLWMA